MSSRSYGATAAIKSSTSTPTTTGSFCHLQGYLQARDSWREKVGAQQCCGRTCWE
jgi:glutamate/tyrosine decarboxylase-like PLP-dependent enzyme